MIDASGVCVSQKAVQALPSLISNMNIHAFFIGAVSLALCTFTPKKITRIIPGSLLALAAGTVLTMAAGFSRLPLLIWQFFFMYSVSRRATAGTHSHSVAASIGTEVSHSLDAVDDEICFHPGIVGDD